MTLFTSTFAGTRTILPRLTSSPSVKIEINLKSCGASPAGALAFATSSAPSKNWNWKNELCSIGCNPSQTPWVTRTEKQEVTEDVGVNSREVPPCQNHGSIESAPESGLRPNLTSSAGTLPIENSLIAHLPWPPLTQSRS